MSAPHNPILIFSTQAAAAAASVSITHRAGYSGSTMFYAEPAALADGRWYLPRPSDDDWMAGLAGYAEAAGTAAQVIPVGEVVPSVPASVTNFQARAVLMGMASPTGVAGRTLFHDVDDALKAEGGVALQAWEYANDVDRNGALVQSLGAKLGLTADQVDGLFTVAASVTA